MRISLLSSPTQRGGVAQAEEDKTTPPPPHLEVAEGLAYCNPFRRTAASLASQIGSDS